MSGGVRESRIAWLLANVPANVPAGGKGGDDKDGCQRGRFVKASMLKQLFLLKYFSTFQRTVGVRGCAFGAVTGNDSET